MSSSPTAMGRGDVASCRDRTTRLAERIRKILSLLVALLLVGCESPTGEMGATGSGSFSFVFATDIHLTPDRHATEGVRKAIDTINGLAPDFVLTGGDNIMDALGQTWDESDRLYTLYIDTISHLAMPVFHTIGNHDIFGWYKESGVDPGHADYGKNLFERRLAKRYYSFDHKGWHFIVLDSIVLTEDRRYRGMVDLEQLEWLQRDLESTGQETPVVVSTHIPLFSAGERLLANLTGQLSLDAPIANAQDVIALLERYNVKLVLQGHLHYLEQVDYHGICFITGGAVSAGWWFGPFYGVEEGFVRVDIAGEEFTWKYVEYGWEARD